MGSEIVVTGCAGFIGSTLVEQLLQAGEHVIGVDCFTDYYAPALKSKNIAPFEKHPNFCLYSTTIQQLYKWHGLYNKQISHVIHLAAFPGVQYSFVRPDYYVEHNVNGTVAALELARSHGAKFIFASSSSVYGNCLTSPFLEPMKPSPISIYGVTKLSGEQFCEMYHRVYGMDVFCLRIFTCYGPKQRPDLAIRKFAEALRDKRPIEIRGDGSMSRDYTYVTDIVDGIMRAKECVSGFDIINLGNSNPIPLSHLLETLQNAMGIRDANISKVAIPTGDVLHTCADIQRAKKILKWQPHVDFATGIQYFLDWLKGAPCESA